MTVHIEHAALARRLWEAEQALTRARPLLADQPDLSIADAYRVQREVDELRLAAGDTPIGRKIGLASRELLARVGAREPFWARVFAGRRFSSGVTLDLGRYFQVLLEPEIALVLGADLAAPHTTREQARAAVRAVAPAFEVVERRTRSEGIVVAETIADSGWNAGCVLGAEIPAGAIDLDAVEMTLHSARSGHLATGRSSALMDGPAGCLAWLANAAAAAGLPLRAGEIVLSGAVTGAAYPLAPGDMVTAEFHGLGTAPAVVTVSAR
jgi:2-keto-4-pentenoate hydratase